MSKRAVNPEELTALRADNARLRAENERLHARKNTRNSEVRKQRSIRSVISAVLVTVAVIVFAAGNILFWFGSTIVKPERFAQATQPLIEDQAVRSASALFLTNKIFEHIDIETITAEALPAKADFLAPALTTQITSFTNSGIQRALENPEVQQTWNRVLANQHERLLGFASRYEGSGVISLDEVFGQITSTLANTKLSFLANRQLPASVGDVTVIDAKWLPVLHRLVENMDLWRFLSLLVLVLSLSSAVWLSAHRRRVLYAFGIGASTMMLATLIGIRLLVSMTAARAESQYTEGVRRVAEIILHPLRMQTITLLVFLLVITAITWVTGTTPRAVTLKNWVSRLFGGTLHDRIFSEEYAATKWIAAHKRLLQWSAVVITGLALLIVNLTLMSLAVYVSLLVVLLLVIELVGGRNQDAKRHTEKSHENNVNLKRGE